MNADVSELRVVITTDDLDRTVALYRDQIGLTEIAAHAAAGGRVVILDAGRATLELTDEAHARHIDEVEVGARVAGPVRLALRVADVDAATDALVAAGTAVLAAPRPTPWGSRNARLDAPGGVQLTLFHGGPGPA